MAVVQISRIQIRRGTAASGGTGLPQLASGELAWAIDTQELYIGNGAVSEGSPGVGNTKIITQKDLTSEGNLFGIVQYVYKTDEGITVSNNTPVARTLQQRLDDQVVTADFGVAGNYDPVHDIGTDDSDALQFAINQLFLNAAGKASADVNSRIILEMPAGYFKITKTLYIPSYTTLIGAGADKTVIYYVPTDVSILGNTIISNPVVNTSSADISMVGANIVGNNIPQGTTILSVVPHTSITLSQAPTSTASAEALTITSSTAAIQFVNDTSSIGAPSNTTTTQYLNSPRAIQLSGLTINVSTGKNPALQLDAVRESLFEDINLNGVLDPNASFVFDDHSRGISMFAKSSSDLNSNTPVATQNNIFRNIKINQFSYGVYARHDVVNNLFENMYIENGRYGMALGIASDGISAGEINGPRQTQIINSKFFNIFWQGIYCPRGDGNTVRDCVMNNVGVEGRGNTDPGTGDAHYPQVFFGGHGNIVQNIVSDRPGDLETTNLDIVYAPILSGHGVYKSESTRSAYLNGQFGQAIRLPVSTTSSGTPTGSMVYAIDYVFKNTVNHVYTRTGTITISVDVDTATLQLSDDYNYAGADISIARYATALDFSAQFLDKVGDPYVSGPQVPYSIQIDYANDGFAVAGYMVYTYVAML